MLRFLLFFLLILGGLFALELTPPGQALVLPWAASLAGFSASLIALFDPKIITYGNIIQSQANGFGVVIEAGCNAVEACIVLAAKTGLDVTYFAFLTELTKLSSWL